ncbi:MAG: hypothetical protein ACOX5Z_03925 [Desulfobulbus sp.]|jgi:rod shape-determining protein MreD
MIIFSFLGIGLLLVLLQTTVFMPTATWPLAPDLYFVLVAYLAFRLDWVRSLIILFCLACVLDVLSGTILGGYGLICFLGFFLIRILAGKLPINESLYQIPLIGLSYLTVFGVVYCALNLFAPGWMVAWSWWKMAAHAVMVALFTYPLFLCFDRVLKFARRGRLPWKRIGVQAEDGKRRRHT